MNTITDNTLFYALAEAQHEPYRRGTLLATASTTIEFPGDDTMTLRDSDAPYVGQPCTVVYYTDRHVSTVIAVSPSGHNITVREDKAIRTDSYGMSDVQHYRYESDANGAVHVFYRGKRGYTARGKRLTLGMRRAYYDYTF